MWEIVVPDGYMVPNHVRMLYRWVRYREGATQQARAYIRRYDG